jgi:hypothetical protein
MNKMFVLVCAFASVFWLCSCTTVTDDAGDAYADMNLSFHNKKFMEKQTIKVPNGVNETRLEKLPFLIGFKQNTEKSGGLTSDVLSDKEFSKLKIDFEGILSASNRFPVAQIVSGLADSDIRKSARNGIANVSELEVSEMEEGQYIINVIATLNKNYFQSGSQAKETYSISLDCTPVEAKNNKPLAWFPKFQCNAKKDIYQEVSSTGFVLKGIDTTNPQQREEIHMEVFRKALILFIDHIYNAFPAGGAIVEIDAENKMAVLKANRATGLMPNLEMVIYAREKGNPDAMRVALYSATLETMGQEGTSELKIWRENSSGRATKIIDQIEKDWHGAKVGYDFFAASDGIAERPDFIKSAGDRK